VTVKAYLLSLPERFVRSALGLGAGVTRELGEIVLPISGIRAPTVSTLRAPVNQFSPKRRTLTQRLLEKLGVVIRA